jgi:hypothetical protein
MLAAARAEAPNPSAGNGRRPPPEPPPGAVIDQWFLNPDKVVLDWVDLEGRLVVDVG